MQGKQIDYGALKSFHFFVNVYLYFFTFKRYNKLVEKSFFCTNFLMERKFFPTDKEQETRVVRLLKGLVL